MDQQLEAEIREVIDRSNIWKVLLRYARGIDRFDRDLVRSCYWDDAIDDHHHFGGTPDQFIDAAFNIHKDWQSITHHNLSNHSCEIVGDDAHAETYYLFLGVSNDPPHLLAMGRYIDHLQKREGEWRIKSRVCVIERNFKIVDDPRAPVTSGDPVNGPVLHASRTKEDLSYMRPVQPRRMSAPDL